MTAAALPGAAGFLGLCRHGGAHRPCRIDGGGADFLHPRRARSGQERDRQRGHHAAVARKDGSRESLDGGSTLALVLRPALPFDAGEFGLELPRVGDRRPGEGLERGIRRAACSAGDRCASSSFPAAPAWIFMRCPGTTVSAYSRRPRAAARTRIPSSSTTDSLTPSPTSAARRSRKGWPSTARSTSCMLAETCAAMLRSRRPR